MASHVHYTLERRLGIGSFGQVWLCYRGQSSEPCAVKVLTGTDPAAAEAMADEVRQAKYATEKAGVHHVPGFLEAAEGRALASRSARVLMIAMDYIDGFSAGSLALEEARMSEQTCKSILCDVCTALTRLHECHLIHRDVKGDNVIVARSGSSFLCDFGLSVFQQNLRGPDGRIQLCGSPFFMAPELLGAEPQYSDRSDMWALGIMGIEIATGRPPHPDSSIQDTTELFEFIALSKEPHMQLAEGFTQAYSQLLSMWLIRDARCRASAPETLQSPLLRFDIDRVHRDVGRWLADIRNTAPSSDAGASPSLRPSVQPTMRTML